jgi:hypothetical protein
MRRVRIDVIRQVASELGIEMQAVPAFHEPYEVLIVKTMQLP